MHFFHQKLMAASAQKTKELVCCFFVFFAGGWLTVDVCLQVKKQRRDVVESILQFFNDLMIEVPILSLLELLALTALLVRRTQYMQVTYPSSEERWTVQRRLMVQLAQYMFLQAVLCLRLPSPRRIILDKETGDVVLLDLNIGTRASVCVSAHVSKRF